MNAQELRKKSTADLRKELVELSKEQMNLRLQKGAGEAAPRPHHYQRVRRDIARVNTILNEKEKGNE